MSFLADKLSNIKPSATLAITSKVAELKSNGKKVINLGAGEPDFDTPDHIKSAAIDAMMNGETKYTPVNGTSALRKAIIEKFRRDNNLHYLDNEVMASSGGKQVIYNAMMATLNHGDEVLIPAPFWVSYPEIVLLAGGSPKYVECKIANNLKMIASDLEKSITPKTKWLIINSPNNPTGAVYSFDELRSIADILLKFEHVHIMSDEIYEHLVYDDHKFYNILQVEPKLKDRVLIVNGVSKTYSMTGWRLGYAAGDSKLISAMSMIQSQSTSCPSSISQAAACAALTSDQTFLEIHKKQFKERRNLAYKMLNEIKGISCNLPKGGFYIFPNCSKLFGLSTCDGKVINNSDDFVNFLLENGLVACVSGSSFGSDGFFRISYAISDELLHIALLKIQEICTNINSFS